MVRRGGGGHRSRTAGPPPSSRGSCGRGGGWFVPPEHPWIRRSVGRPWEEFVAPQERVRRHSGRSCEELRGGDHLPEASVASRALAAPSCFGALSGAAELARRRNAVERDRPSKNEPIPGKYGGSAAVREPLGVPFRGCGKCLLKPDSKFDNQLPNWPKAIATDSRLTPLL